MDNRYPLLWCRDLGRGRIESRGARCVLPLEGTRGALSERDRENRNALSLLACMGIVWCKDDFFLLAIDRTKRETIT